MANPQTLTLSASDITSTTLPGYAPIMADAISKNVGLLNELKKSGTNKPIAGGVNIRKSVNFDELRTVFPYSDYEKFNITPNETFTYLVFDWKQVGGTTSTSGREEAINEGDETQIHDIVKERVKVLERSFTNQLGGSTIGVYSDGTNYGGKSLGGLQYLITPVPTVGVVGGVDRATNAWNRNQVYKALTDGGAVKSTANFKRYLNKLYLKCSRGEKPDIFIADDNDFSIYEEALQAIQQVQDADSADAGYQYLMYKGNRFMFDGGFGGSCPANTTYMLNSKHIFYHPHKNRNIVPLKNKEPVDQDATIKSMVWMGNLAYDIAFLNGILTNG